MKSLIHNNRKKFFLIPLGIAALLALVSYVVMQLWNHILPEVIQVQPISFWQAMGIFLLCKLLFGFGKGEGGAPWMRKKMEMRYNGMTPEEKQNFKARMKDKMCNWKKDKSDNTY